MDYSTQNGCFDKDFIGKQIKAICKARKIGLNEFANELNLPYQTVMNYSNGRSYPKIDFLYIISGLGIDLHWFVTGKGEMYRAKRDASTTTINIDNGSREARLYRFIHEFLATADDDQSVWFEVQLSRCFAEYTQWKKQNDC